MRTRGNFLLIAVVCFLAIPVVFKLTNGSFWYASATAFLGFGFGLLSAFWPFDKKG